MLRGIGRMRGATGCKNALVILLIVAVLFSLNFSDARPVTSSLQEELQGLELNSVGAVENGIERVERFFHVHSRMRNQGQRMLLSPCIHDPGHNDPPPGGGCGGGGRR